MSSSDGIFGIPHGIANGADEPLPYLLGITVGYVAYEIFDDSRVTTIAVFIGLIAGLVVKTTTELALDPV
jgi:hypothetical protein